MVILQEMKKFNFILVIIVFLTATACEKEIEFNGEIQDKKVVLNSFAVADSILTAELYFSKFFLDNKVGFDTIKTADIDLFVNGDFNSKLEFKNVTIKHEEYWGGYTFSRGMYVSTYRPQPGDQLELKVNVDGYEPISTQTIMPQRATIDRENLTVRIDTTDTYESSYYNENGELVTYYNYSLEMIYNLKITDNVDEDNYYRLILQNAYGGYEYIYSEDPIFNQEGDQGIFDLIEGTDYNYFSDESFNGETRSITFSDWAYSSSWENNVETRFLDVQQLSREAYLYMKTSYQSGLNEGNIFSEPVLTYTNVKGGLGIFAGITKSKTPINLLAFPPK